jgi:hypothetical protein
MIMRARLGFLSLGFVPVVVYYEKPLLFWDEIDVSQNDFEVPNLPNIFGANNFESIFEFFFVFPLIEFSFSQ